MRILITGGAGYLGTELVEILNESPQVEEIIVFDNLSRANFNFFIFGKYTGSKIRFVDAELLDTRRLKKSLEGVDVVYHLAAKVTTPFADQDPHTFEQTNQWGTAELTYALEESSVKRLIYSSSASVYGSGNKPYQSDKTPNPKTYYGISKLRGEEMVERFFMEDSPIKAYTIRLGNIYGYNKSVRFDAVINKFLFEAHFKHKITIQGNGTQKRSFINVRQAAQALSRLAVDEQITPGAYNLADKTLTINDVGFGVRELYPTIDIQYVQQSLTLKSLEIENDPIFQDPTFYEMSDFMEDLREFKERMAF